MGTPFCGLLLPALIFVCFAFSGCGAEPPPQALEEATEESLSTLLSSPTLDDFWEGRALFQVDVEDTGLPMGESDTLQTGDGEYVSYVHASWPSLGVVDQCGAPVEFPGCVVRFHSLDSGQSFMPELDNGIAQCLIPCGSCPCRTQFDHIDQQQYPRIFRAPLDGATLWVMVYEYRANTILRRSTDGIAWSAPEEIPLTGIWQRWLARCAPTAAIGPHPFTLQQYDCLMGGPPGVYIDGLPGDEELYLFVGLGQNPGAMGCYRMPLTAATGLARPCSETPLFRAEPDYGPTDTRGRAANPYLGFRTISSAEVVRVGSRYYMLYEGVRGPAAGDAGDTQFALGLARTLQDRIDGPWETFAGNPILVDLPGNVGLGHADLVTLDGHTVLYTSLDGVTRSRLRLEWGE